MYLRDDEYLRPVFVSGDDQRLFHGHVVKIGEGLTGWVAKTSNTIINGNPAVELGPLHKNGTKLKSALAVPMHSVRDARDKILGVLVVYSTHADAFTRDHLRVLCAVAEKAAGSIENSLDYQRVESEAVTDFLTGILNSRGFMLEAEKRLSESEVPLTLLACDLDEFKSVNDTEGHAAGDQLLRKVAEILITLCGTGALLGRLGGDEFVALVPSFSESETRELMFAIDRGIKEASAKMLDGRRIGASIGAATFGPDGETVADVAAVADRRMYDQKRGAGENSRMLQIVRAS
jgi:diguanylate cyclase (GGDEF)-like protein